MKKSAKNASELLIGSTVDNEVDGAVEHRQVASHNVNQVLPFRAKILPNWRVETVNHQFITKLSCVKYYWDIYSLSFVPADLKNAESQSWNI